MRFFVDEDLSPILATECHRAGYDATSTRDRGMLGASDLEVAQLCMDEERVLVTNNADDFIDLAEQAGLHPGLVIMPLGSRSEELVWMGSAITHIERLSRGQGVEPCEAMINLVVEVDDQGNAAGYDYP